jgi:hypothetical protein
MKEEMWITESGKAIPVGEMTEIHVRNVLRMLIRQFRNHRNGCIEFHIEQQDRLGRGEPLVDDTQKNGMHA